ncbi:MAG: Uncharacterized protein XD58_0790 [Thermotoga sp. 50_1627]|uniref:DUF6062 family protein n=1 Tax=Pseudothermotoga sp. TaxID=2033661 RepID=UPI00076D6E3A|nr:MAG: Uncharacterized protein XD45_1130 [Thermotoga sp. 50_64]KUK25168.1 MAG: Uncharacterized protein XD58_0790 [Thermotoga sp. 50_1627]MDK2923651.1 hypothetical protein [Pseudothermotoga sp.]HBT39367.1 hypothetical protein [Pseudothermotoga sp.]HCO97240.1 hypothetical protein [Pseudothermotoga sp.]
MDLIEISLKDAISQTRLECPICLLTDKALDSTIDSLLYEMVNDVLIRSELRYKGLCRRHVTRIETYLSRHMELGSMGLAIIYSDLLDHLADLLKSGSNLQRSSSCVLCEREKTFESLYLKAFLENVGELVELYKSSQSVLCFDHYAFIFSKLKNSLKADLKEVQLSKYRHLVKLLNSFVNKHDYRNKESFTAEELSARKTAGKLIAKNLDQWRSSK